MNFKDFLKESVSNGQYKTVLNESDIVSTIKEKCSDYLNNKNRPTIYRGSGDKSKSCTLISTKFTKRKSANTNNAYTVVLDKTLTKDYPKRSESIICTTWEHKASYYGEIYIILPCNGSKIGDTCQEDIWYAKYYNNIELKRLPKVINMFESDFLNGEIEEMQTYQDVVDIVSKLCQYEDLPEIECFLDGQDYDDLDELEINNLVYDTLQKYISPKNLKFKAYTPSNIPNVENHELWIGGEMISVPLYKWKEIQNEF